MAKKAHADRPVQAYLAGIDPKHRAALERVQAAILAVAPDAVEGMSYGMPAFKLDGKGIAAFAVFKGHLSLFPMSGSVLGDLDAETKGFRVSKGAIQFTLEKPLPLALVKRIVKARVAELRAGKGR